MAGSRIIGILVILALILPLAGVGLQARAEEATTPPLLTVRSIPGTAIGVVGSKALYVDRNGMLHMVDLLRWKDYEVGFLSLYGLPPHPNVLVSDGTALLYGNYRIMLVDSSGTDYARFAAPGAKGFIHYPDNDVLWDKRYVLVIRHGIIDESYDLLKTVYSILSQLTADEIAKLAGINVSRIVHIEAENILSKGGCIDRVTKIPILSNITVEVEAAGYIGAKLYAAVSVKVPILIEIQYCINNVEKKTQKIVVGTFAAVVDLEEARFEETYKTVIPVAHGNILAYAAVSDETTVYFVSEDNIALCRATIPLSEWKPSMLEAYTVGRYAVVKDVESNVGIILDRRYCKLMGIAPLPGKIHLAESEEGTAYIAYQASPGVLEVAVVPGLYGILKENMSEPVVGLYYYKGVLIIVSQTKAYYYLVGKPARILIRFSTSAPVRQVDYTIRVAYWNLTYTITGSGTAVDIVVPEDSILFLDAYGPLMEGHATIYADRSKEVVVQLATIPVHGLTIESYKMKPFVNPFFRDYIITDDEHIAKTELAPGKDVEIADGVVAILGLDRRTVYGYTLDGKLLYKVLLPKQVNHIDVRPPYLIAVSPQYLYILSLRTGTIIAESPVTPYVYDIDVANKVVAISNGQVIYVRSLVDSSTVSYRGAGTVESVLLKWPDLIAVEKVGSKLYMYLLDAATGEVKSVFNFTYGDVKRILSSGEFRALVVGGNTYVLTPEGIVQVPGEGVWLKDLGEMVDVPVTVQGYRFAVLAVKAGNEIVIYIVGKNAVEAARIPANDAWHMSFTPWYITMADASHVYVKDYTGKTRLVISICCKTIYDVAADGVSVAYATDKGTFLLNGVHLLGKYYVKIKVTDEAGNPLNATINVEPVNASIEVPGETEFILSMPGVYTITAYARHFEPSSVKVNLTPVSPTAFATIRLKHKLYPLTILAVDNHKNPVYYAEIEVEGPTSARATLRNGKGTVYLIAGRYTLRIISPFYAPVTIYNVSIPENMTIEVQTNITGVPLVVHVTADGKPVKGATVIVRGPKLPAGRITLRTNESGYAEYILPFGNTYRVTVSYPGYTSYTATIKADYTLFNKTIEVTLQKFTGMLDITVKTEDGKPVTATVKIMGPITKTVTVSGHTRLPVPAGSYVLTAETSWGKARTTVQVSPENPVAKAELVLPPKPKPVYVRVLPYLGAAVVAAGVAVMIVKIMKGRARRTAKVAK